MKVKNDHRSKCSNLSNWKEEAWKKKNQGFNGIRTRDLRVAGALLYQLSYEATHWERGQFSPDFFFRLLLSNCLNWKIYCDDHFSLSEVILVGWFSKCQSIKKVGADVSQKKVCIRLSFRFALLARMLFTKRNENWAWSQVT